MTIKDNIMIENYYVISLLTELKNNNFLNSDYYKNMDFSDTFVKENLKKTGLDNSGLLLTFLYSLFIIPRKVIGNKLDKEFQKLNKWISDNNENKYSNIDYLSHIENAIINVDVILTDQYLIITDKEIVIKLKKEKIGILFSKLQKIFFEYIKILQKQN